MDQGKNREISHLVKWENLTLPKKWGGWGFKNIYWFDKDLNMKHIWSFFVLLFGLMLFKINI